MATEPQRRLQPARPLLRAAHDLADEQWIPLGLRVQFAISSVEATPRPSARRTARPRPRSVRRGRDGGSRVLDQPPPAFRSEVCQELDRHPDRRRGAGCGSSRVRGRGTGAAEGGGRVGRVKIVQEEHERLPLGCIPQEIGGCGEQSEARCLRLQRGGLRQVGEALPSSGRICAAPRPPAPSPSAAPSSLSRARARSDCTHGQYAGAPPASQQRPTRISAPRAVACAISSARRLLPMPGSPPSRNTRPRPANVSSRPVATSASSRSRPTNALRALWGAGSVAACPSAVSQASSGSCASIARSSSRRCSPGSMPSSSTSSRRVLVGLQGVHLPVAAVEGEHQLRRKRSR